MNLADSERLAKMLESAGYQATLDIGQADIVLVNTCVVRQHAEDRAAGYIRSIKNLKQKKPHLKIALCGCLVTEPGRDIRKQFPHVDFFIPPHNSEKLAEYLHLTFDICHLSFSKHGPASTSYVSIMHGCDNFCSYCIVPYVRGREYSRPVPEVLAEIKYLIDSGIKEITLLGQNVNSYKYGLADLLRKIHSFDICHLTFVIRFLTSHPRDMSDEIIETVAELPYVAKEFIMPLQSGDDEILQRMNRGYTLAHYLGRIKKIRSLMPEARITSDILVGFPGETEEQFRNTLKAVQEIRFDEVHMFAYSERPDTAAARMPGHLDEAVKQERLQRLIRTVRPMVAKI
jgi:tRNA-2-methylthio-N6-dimethylallyladenosine synthase